MCLKTEGKGLDVLISTHSKCIFISYVKIYKSSFFLPDSLKNEMFRNTIVQNVS